MPTVLCFPNEISNFAYMAANTIPLKQVPDRTDEQGRRSIHRTDQRNDACENATDVQRLGFHDAGSQSRG